MLHCACRQSRCHLKATFATFNHNTSTTCVLGQRRKISQKPDHRADQPCEFAGRDPVYAPCLLGLEAHQWFYSWCPASCYIPIPFQEQLFLRDKSHALKALGNVFKDIERTTPDHSFFGRLCLVHYQAIQQTLPKQ